MTDWSWKLRLFTSADLIGSTAYKQSNSDSTQQWAGTFKEFFTGFPKAVEAAYDHLPEKCLRCENQLQPWKFAGDEILFHTTLKSFKESISHIAAFKRAVKGFPEEWKKKKVPLTLKATAWLAGFPVNNTEIEINTVDGTSRDFIGSAIDLGFRISKFADSRRFVLSADLACMILDAVYETECESEQFQIHLLSSERLKGLIDDRTYPILWLDIEDGSVSPTLEEEILGIGKTPDAGLLRKYLLAFIDSTPRLMRPFIAGDPHERYGTIPKDLAKIRDEMEAEESYRGYDGNLAPTLDEYQELDIRSPPPPPAS